MTGNSLIRTTCISPRQPINDTNLCPWTQLNIYGHGIIMTATLASSALDSGTLIQSGYSI